MGGRGRIWAGCSVEKRGRPVRLCKNFLQAYTEDELVALGRFYKKSLLEDTMPFWLPRSIDHEHGGYLHRDGRISVPLKGNLYKGPFHLPRMQWMCSQMTEGGHKKGTLRTASPS